MTPADIPSLVERRHATIFQAEMDAGRRGVDIMDADAVDRYRDMWRGKDGHDMAPVNFNSLRRLVALIDHLADALSPKEAELVKPPREYEVSGDAVGGGRVDCGHCGGVGDIDDGDHPCMICGGSGKVDAPRTPTASHDAARELLAAWRPEPMTPETVPEWVKELSPDEYAKRRNEEHQSALFSLDVSKDWLTVAASMLYTAGTMSPSEYGSYGHSCIIVADALIATRDAILAALSTPDASEHMRETFNEGLWTGWRAGLAGEQMNDDYASTSWDVSDAAAQLDTASERMREAGQ